MRSKLRTLGDLRRREVRDERLPPRRRGHTTRMLERAAPRAEMKAELEQMGPLQLQEARREMDPDPLADYLRGLPLARETHTDELQNLEPRQRPMLPMEGATEPTREPKRRSPRRQRTPDGRLRLRLTYRMCIFLFHIFFKS